MLCSFPGPQLGVQACEAFFSGLTSGLRAAKAITKTSLCSSFLCARRARRARFLSRFRRRARKKSFCRLTRLEHSLPLESPTRRLYDAFQLPAATPAAAAAFSSASRLHLFFD